MLTRLAPTTINAPFSHAARLVSFEFFSQGIDPQIARHRGCDTCAIKPG